jgi:hypothetical protein
MLQKGRPTYPNSAVSVTLTANIRRFDVSWGGAVSGPSMRWEPVDDLGDGSIVAVVYTGRIPIGSAGNPVALEFIRFLERVLAETQPAGVVLDLTDVDYVFGDAIGALAHPLLRLGAERRWKIPVALIAVGRTSTALTPLLGPNTALGILGAKLFADHESAVGYVKAAIRRQAAAAR